MAVDTEKNKQVLVTFPIDMLDEVEIYWHKQKLANRNEAIRELVKLGLDNTKDSRQ